MKLWLLVKHEWRAGTWRAALIPLAMTAYVMLIVNRSSKSSMSVLFFLFCLSLLLPSTLGFVYREYCREFSFESKYPAGQEFIFAHAVNRRNWLLVKNLFFWAAYLWLVIPLTVYHSLTVSDSAGPPSASGLFILLWLAMLAAQTLFFACLAYLALTVVMNLLLLGLVVFITLLLDWPDFTDVERFCTAQVLPLTLILLVLTVGAHHYGVKRLANSEVC
ncbi:MAG: hypothetical protein LBK60_08790 [Verrucomicrobiales bacterium]|jgi:hypothetical protein|nr:hypothetical protein [Verrucomicrobiales bacterium]